MPLFLDIHQPIPGLTARAIAGAHAKDLQAQPKHDVKYLKYWFDEGTGKVFCLVEAPSRKGDAAVRTRGSPGLLAGAGVYRSKRRCLNPPCRNSLCQRRMAEGAVINRANLDGEKYHTALCL